MKHFPALFLCLAVVAAGALGLVASNPARALDGDGLHPVQGRNGGPGLAAPFVPTLPPNPERRGPSRARDAVQRGEIRPLEEVTARVQQRFPGRLLDAHLEQEGGRWVYYLKMLTHDGRVLNVAVDARTAQVLGIARRR